MYDYELVTTKADRVAKRCYAFLALLVILGMLDMASTLRFSAHGFLEGNPLMAPLVDGGHVYSYVTLKVTMTLMAGSILFGIIRSNRLEGGLVSNMIYLLVLFALDVFYVYVVLSNFMAV